MMRGIGCLLRSVTVFVLVAVLVFSACVTGFPVGSTAADGMFGLKASAAGNEEHPYLYLNKTELATLKTYLNKTGTNAYGFTWKSQYDSLISMANGYLREKSVEQGFNAGTSVTFELQPVLIDPNDDYYDPLYLAASTIDGKLVEYPHLGFGCLIPDTLRVRMETLSLAYVLTGDTRYSDLAISYAVQMCGWEFWGDWYWLDTYTNHKTKADASNAWATQAVAAVYDLCYDRLTAQQKTAIEQGIIAKGLEPMYQAVNPYSTANGNMMLVGGMLTGIAAIRSNSNADQLQKYTDKALLCVEKAFDQYATSGNTEGHYYTGFGLDYFLPGVMHFYRATGMKKLVEHPLLSQMLPYWTVMFAAPQAMDHPNYSDGGVGVQLKLPMAVISKLVNDPLANYFLTQTKGLNSPFQNLVYLNPEPKVKVPTDHVAVVDPIGYGALRTGFAADDMLLTMIANNSQMGHNHYDQNSIQFNVGGSWIIGDPGAGSYYYSDRSFWESKGHSTVLVDGNPQSVLGTGSMKKVFDSGLYGYIIGSAPKAYGNKLTKFDRHAIQVNHGEKAYYVVIDDLLSGSSHEYGWQMFNGERVGLYVDGKLVSENSAAKGNQVSMTVGAHKLNMSFVDSSKLSIADKIYEANGSIAGYTMVASSAAAKAHQFMTVISTEEVYGRTYYNFAGALAGESTATEHTASGGISWKSSNNQGKTIVKSNSVGTLSTIFFRGGGAGDYIKIPFTVKKDGTYNASLLLGVSDGCCKVKAYIDSTASAVVDCSGLPETSKSIELKNLRLSAGQHYVTVEIVGKGASKDYADGHYLINAGGLILDDVNAAANGRNAAVTVAETYDTAAALGALINYTGGLHDLVMFNRTTASAAAGKLTTNGKQASVLGLSGDKITEGFAAMGATTLKYGTKVLFEAQKPVDIVADQEGWHISSTQAQSVKLRVDPSVKCHVIVNGKKVNVAAADSMITLSVAKGESDVVFVSEGPAPTEPVQTNPTATGSVPTDPSTGGAVPTDPSTGELLPTDPLTGAPLPPDLSTGKPIPTDPSTGKPAPTDPTADAPIQTDPADTQPDEEGPDGGSGWIMWTVLGVAVAAAGGAAAWWFIRKRKQKMKS